MIRKVLLILFAALFVSTASIQAAEEAVTLDKTYNAPNAVQIQTPKYKEVSPLELVYAPSKYLDKSVKIKGKFVR